MLAAFAPDRSVRFYYSVRVRDAVEISRLYDGSMIMELRMMGSPTEIQIHMANS